MIQTINQPGRSPICLHLMCFNRMFFNKKLILNPFINITTKIIRSPQHLKNMYKQISLYEKIFHYNLGHRLIVKSPSPSAILTEIFFLTARQHQNQKNRLGSSGKNYENVNLIFFKKKTVLLNSFFKKCTNKKITK